MAEVSGVCEQCHQRKPVKLHDPPLKGMSWLCWCCSVLLRNPRFKKYEVRK